MYDMDKGGGAGQWWFQERIQPDNTLLKVFPNDDDRRKLKDMVTSELIKQGFQIADPMNPLLVTSPPGTGYEHIIAVFYLRNVPRMNAQGTQQLPPINITVNVNPVQVPARPVRMPAAGMAWAAGAGAAGAGAGPVGAGAGPAPGMARGSVPIRRERMIMYDENIGRDEGHTWWFQPNLTYDSRDGDEENGFLYVMPEQSDRDRLKADILQKLQNLGIEPEDPSNPYRMRVPRTLPNVRFTIPNFQTTGANPMKINIRVVFENVVPRPSAAAARDPEEDEACAKLLRENGIVNKSTFRQWALANHPDKKKGNEAKFQEVSDCYDKILKPKFGGRRKSRRKRRSAFKTIKKRHFSRRR